MRHRDNGRDDTYEFLLLTAVLDLDVGLASLVEDLEREVLDIGLHFGVIEFTTNETLGVEHTKRQIASEDDSNRWQAKANLRVMRVHSDLVLRGVTNQTLVLREGDI